MDEPNPAAEHADRHSYLGIGLITAGAAFRFGWDVAAMVAGAILLGIGLWMTLRVLRGAA